MKSCSCTAIGVIAGVAAVVGGIAADMMMSHKCGNRNSGCVQAVCQTAGRAMHTLGTKLDNAARNSMGN